MEKQEEESKIGQEGLATISKGLNLEELNKIEEELLKIEKYQPEQFWYAFRELASIMRRIGENELSRRAARLMTREAIIELQRWKERGGLALMADGWGHILHHSYLKEHLCGLNDEIKRTLGEMDAKVSEAYGNFERSYRLYSENCPEKYSNKLASANDDRSSQKKVRDKYGQIVTNNIINYPDFIELTEEDAEALTIKYINEFTEIFNKSEFFNINPSSELNNIIAEAKKIIEEQKDLNKGH